MKKHFFALFFLSSFCVLIFTNLNCSAERGNKKLSQAEMIDLGRYIVTTSGCDDCHTPKIFTPQGPVFDTTRRFSGYPQGEKLSNIDASLLMDGNWVAGDKHLAAWVGPWGISFASNLTPDNATGIGALSEEMFIKCLREGKYMGVGRPLLPPMPWNVYGLKTDEDLKAIYAYLMSLKPIRNEVPQPVPPDKMKEFLSMK